MINIPFHTYSILLFLPPLARIFRKKFFKQFQNHILSLGNRLGENAGEKNTNL